MMSPLILENRRDNYPIFIPPLDPINTPIFRQQGGNSAVGPHILIMRLAAFGDVLMATPLLESLRRAYPTSRITWIVERKQSDTIIANPHVDEIILFEGRYWKRLLRRGLGPVWLFAALKFKRQLEGKQFDIFISMQPEEWPTLTRVSNAKTKIGIFDTFARFNRSEKTSNLVKIYSHPFTSADLPVHRTDQYLLALKALDLPIPSQKRMSLGFTAEDRLTAESFLTKRGLTDGQPFVVIAPFTTWQTRCWPADRFALVADKIGAAGYKIVLIGSAKESPLLHELSVKIDRMPIVSDGNLTFRETSALISRSSLVISGDTGPMHAAAALGIPHVSIFGPTSPLWYGPLESRGQCLSHSVPCGPCDQKICPISGSGRMQCMELVTVDEVLESSFELLK